MLLENKAISPREDTLTLSSDKRIVRPNLVPSNRDTCKLIEEGDVVDHKEDIYDCHISSVIDEIREMEIETLFDLY